MKYATKRRSRVALAAGGAALALSLLVGCSVPGAGSGDGSSSFKISMYDPVNLTPANTWDYNLSKMLFTTPMDLDAETGEPVPAAAKSVESDDQLTWTITLQDGWKFHNGEPVTSASFIRAWNAAALGKNAWLQNGSFNKIAGYADLNPAEGEATTTELSGLTEVSETEFTVTLTEPFGLFPYLLTSNAFAPMPEAAFEDIDGFGKKPIGNGPYSIDNAYEPNQPVDVTRFDEYQGKAGNAEKITFVPYQSQDTAFNDLLAGNLDIVYPVPPDRLAEVDGLVDGRTAVSKIPNLNYLGLPLWDERFADVKVRQALSLAIDRDAFTEKILNGAGAPASSIAPDTVVGAQEGVCDACTYDPERAKQLLEEAGGWSGEMVLYGDQYAGRDQELQAMANQFKKVLGIDDVTFELSSYAKHAEIVDAKQAQGPFQLYMGAYYPHVSDFLGPLVTTDGYGNKTGYSNPKVDELVAQANALPVEEGLPLFEEAERLLWEDQPIIPLYYGYYTAAWSENVKSVPVGFSGLGDLRDVQVN
ncbi:peptide/nickel transport system substrate-binding protein/oligopeptide transport system substrate-binding protein [Leucobacter komagatae]|uniref:Peptide/nickel transport system substrate-binding protein/oligopeptide transport system substrate-binding protein n=1 Tax=Leucobacter komagatae TaxID=55969 RepID=A0A542XXX9_9MICO|nr:ABC transporter substrate-binding protein [Leucobacter komagatae]TQL40684.1 peptide/nickel transport system substrate-binding protein/oligopeptide transport system substrate-binding protein [Leucobacter komagatae]